MSSDRAIWRLHDIKTCIVRTDARALWSIHEDDLVPLEQAIDAMLRTHEPGSGD